MTAAKIPLGEHLDPLRVHVLFHPGSTAARELALHLFELLTSSCIVDATPHRTAHPVAASATASQVRARGTE